MSVRMPSHRGQFDKIQIIRPFRLEICPRGWQVCTKSDHLLASPFGSRYLLEMLAEASSLTAGTVLPGGPENPWNCIRHPGEGSHR